MAQHPFSQAAKLVGVTRQTIYKYVDKGRLTATTDHQGQKVIETSELLRVFGGFKGGDSSDDSQRQSLTLGDSTGDTALLTENATLKAQLDDARRQLAESKEREREALEREQRERARVDELLEVVRSQARQLTYERPAAVPAQDAPTPTPEPVAAPPAPMPPAASPEPARSSDDAAAKLAALWRQATKEKEEAVKAAKRQRKH